MRTLRPTSLLLMSLLGGLLVLASCTTRGGRSGGRSGDDDDASADDDDSAGDDDDSTAGDDDDAGHGDDDDSTAGDDDDAGHGDDDDSTAGDDDDAGHGDDDDSTAGDDDDAGHGDDDDSTVGDDDDSTGGGAGACSGAPDATLVVSAGFPGTTTIDLTTNGMSVSPGLGCSSGGGNNALIQIATTSAAPITISFDHTGGDLQYEVFDVLAGTCPGVMVDFNGTSVGCVDPIPDVTGTLTFTPATAVGMWALVVEAYDSSTAVSVDISVSQ